MVLQVENPSEQPQATHHSVFFRRSELLFFFPLLPGALDGFSIEVFAKILAEVRDPSEPDQLLFSSSEMLFKEPNGQSDRTPVTVLKNGLPTGRLLTANL